MRGFRVALCAPLLAIPLQAAGVVTVHAVDDNDHVECVVNGVMTTSPAGPQTVSFAITLSLSCTPANEDGGTWVVTIQGQQSPGFCAGGQGLGAVNGNGPEGGVSGNVQVTSSATNIQIEGAWNNSGDVAAEAFKATLVASSTSGTPCVTSNTSASLTGEASITDEPPPPDEVACSMVGAEGYSGITTALSNVALNGSVTLRCTEPNTSDDAGVWGLSYTGQIQADCGVSDGVFTDSGGGPEGSASGVMLDYDRVGTLLFMDGFVYVGNDQHRIGIWATVTFTSGNCTSTPWTAANLSGEAAFAEGA